MTFGSGFDRISKPLQSGKIYASFLLKIQKLGKKFLTKVNACVRINKLTASEREAKMYLVN